MLCSLGLFVVGAMACMFLKDGGREEIVYDVDDSMYYNETKKYWRKNK